MLEIMTNVQPTKQLEQAIAQELENKQPEIAMAELLEDKEEDDDRPGNI